MSNSRRNMLKGIALSSAALAASTVVSGCASSESNEIDNNANQPGVAKFKGNINHSVARWTYGDLSIEELCQVVQSLGFSAIDLIGPDPSRRADS